jgi:hypothetical protein
VDQSIQVVVAQLENRWPVDSIALLEQSMHDEIVGHLFFCRFSAVLSLLCSSSHKKK